MPADEVFWGFCEVERLVEGGGGKSFFMQEGVFWGAHVGLGAGLVALNQALGDGWVRDAWCGGWRDGW